MRKIGLNLVLAALLPLSMAACANGGAMSGSASAAPSGQPGAQASASAQPGNVQAGQGAWNLGVDRDFSQDMSHKPVNAGGHQNYGLAGQNGGGPVVARSDRDYTQDMSHKPVNAGGHQDYGLDTGPGR